MKRWLTECFPASELRLKNGLVADNPQEGRNSLHAFIASPIFTEEFSPYCDPFVIICTMCTTKKGSAAW